MLIVIYSRGKGDMLIAERDGERFKLSFDRCVHCKGIVRVLEPLEPGKEPERVCKCSLAARKVA